MKKEDKLQCKDFPEWVTLRFREYVRSVGGKAEFMEKYNIKDSYMSYLWTGRRPPPVWLHELMGIEVVITPPEYRMLKRVEV